MTVTLAQQKAEYTQSILDGMARTLWVMAYAEYVDANAQCEICGERIYSSDEGHTWETGEGVRECPDNDGDAHVRDTSSDQWQKPKPGGDWDQVAPTTPAVAYACAEAIRAGIELLESVSIADLFELAMNIDQGEFEWFEEGHRKEDSAAKRKQHEDKHEAAHELGSGLAHQSLGSGVAWGDDRKTTRGGAVFDPKVPVVMFDIADREIVNWSVVIQGHPDAQRSGSDSVTRIISIGARDVEPGTRPFGDEEIEIDPDDLQGYDSVPEYASNALGEAGAERPSSDTYSDDVYYIGDTLDPDGAYMGPGLTQSLGASRAIKFHLAGFFPIEKEWTFYLFTGGIGEITIINSPSSSDSYDYQSRRSGVDGVSDGNILFWFGQGAPTRLLVFGTNVDDALEECAEWLEEHAPGHLVGDEVEEKRKQLVEKACEKRGVPEESMLPDRVIEKCHEEAEEGTFSLDQGRYLRSEEFGVEGQNLTLAELKRIGGIAEPVVQNPHRARAMKVADIDYIDRDEQKKQPSPSDTIKVTPLPFLHRPTADRSKRR